MTVETRTSAAPNAWGDTFRLPLSPPIIISDRRLHIYCMQHGDSTTGNPKGARKNAPEFRRGSNKNGRKIAPPSAT